MDDHEAEQRSFSARRHRVPVERTAMRAGRAGRVPQPGTRGTPLDEELAALGAFKEECVVLGECGTGPVGASGRRVAGRDRGRKRRIRNRMVATASPCWSLKSIRVVTKWPSPSAVCFSDDTSSTIDCNDRRSPMMSGRKYSCSQFVATTEVNPAPSNNARSLSWGELSSTEFSARMSSDSTEAL